MIGIGVSLYTLKSVILPLVQLVNSRAAMDDKS